MTDRAAQAKQTHFFAFKPLNCRSIIRTDPTDLKRLHFMDNTLWLMTFQCYMVAL